MQKITHSKLVEILAQSKGAFPVSLLSETDAKARKTGNPFGQINKISAVRTFTGADYENAVNREANRQGAEGEFESEGLPDWKEQIVKNKVFRHKTEGTLYFRTQTTPEQRKRSRSIVLAYRGPSGQFLKPSEVKPFLPPKSVSRKQESAGLSSKKQVEVREFKFDSIRKIRMNGETFELVND